MHLRALAGALVTALLILTPSAASADVGKPIDLGAGQNPNVTLEAGTGTAYIAYTGQGANSTELDFCRLPRGATACSPHTIINAPGDSLTKPLAFGSGNAVNVISYRYGLSGPFSQVLLFQSGDGGATFGPGTPIGTVPPFDFAFGPTGFVSAVTDAVTAELDYQAWSLTGNTANKAALDGDPYEYQGQIAMLDANTPLVVYMSRSGDGRFRRFSGVGDPNDVNGWAPAVDIGKLDRPHLVYGPNGVILLAQNDLSGPALEARRFDGTTFGSRTTVDSNQHADHAVEDGDGRVHVIGSAYSPTADGAVFYASSYDGQRWLKEKVDYPALPQNMRLAVNPDHYGTIVGTLYSNGHVFAAGIGPAAAAPAPGKFVGASVVSGTVLVQIPPSGKFVKLEPGDVIPVGSVVDATAGRARITIKLPNGKLQSTDFYSGVFRVTQAKAGLATMVLSGGSFKACGARRAVAQAAKSKKVIRQLWGSGGGKFRTKGRYAAAAIRGTTWDTIDRCDGTLVRVTQGKVAVTNLKTNKVKIVKKGQSFFVAA